MKKFITHLLAVALGFGLGFFTFVEPNGDSLVFTLGEVGQMSAEELHEFLITNEECAKVTSAEELHEFLLTNEDCVKVTDQTIECEF